MGIYQDYAAVYDASGQLAFSLRMIAYLDQLLTRHAVEGRTMLELACGTGTVAIAMAHKGWRVWAVDGSERMLAQARAKEGGDHPAITWLQQDMRLLRLPSRVHLATCLYDSLNYMLTSEDLGAVFKRVYQALLPGGLFCFDMNTARALASWDDETYFTDTDVLSTIMHCDYDASCQRIEIRIVCFERVGDLYRKIAETHTEQAYPEEQIATLLVDAGFSVEAAYRCFTFEPPDEETMRVMWAARKPLGERGTDAHEL
ncbi:MAG: class I SAM-dependent methyltransferase [Chloroflexi bacterium]|nr:class I SAM-dependent methyltransferase [Chloroflexota bacterium]